MAGEYNLSVIMSAQDKASNVVQSFLSKLGPVGGVVAGVAATLVGVGAASIKMAGDFQAAMIKSQAEAGLTQSQVTQMGNAILAMAPAVGQSPTQLANGLFFVESAGFAGKDALDTLRLSAQMAANDMSDTSTVAKGLTAAVKAFGYSTSQSAMVANQMTVTVASGKMTMSDYANVIGKTAQMAKQFHVSMSETNAGLDTLTNNGFPSAATAGTALQNVLSQFDGNTDKITKNIHALGLQFDENKFKSMSLGQQVQYLNTVMKGHSDQLQKVLGGSKSAALGFNALVGGAAGYTSTLQKLNDAQKDGGAETQAFAATQQGFNFKMQQAQAATDAMMIKLGQYLIPIVEQAGGAVADIVSKFADWVTKSNVVPNTLNAIGTAVQNTKNFINGAVDAVKNIVTWYNNWKPIINTVAGAITVFFLPAIIKTGVEAVISGAKIAAGFIANLITTGVQAVTSAAKVTASFIASMVQAGAQAWIQGGKVVAGFVSSIITTGTQAVVNAAKVTSSFVASMATTATQAVVSAAKVTASFVASMITAGVQAVTSAAKVTASFIASMIATGTQAVISGAKVVASFIASLISAAAEAIVSGATIMASIVPALLATAAGALATAAPFILIGLVVAAVVIGVILAIQHWGQIMNWLKGVWAGISAGLQAGLKFLSGVWAGIWHGMQVAIQAVWNAIIAALKIGAQILLDIIIGPIGMLVIYIIQHWTQIQKFIFDAWNTIKNDAMNAWSNLVNGINGHLSSFWNMINNFFGGLPAKMLNFGREMIQNLINGIMGMIGAVGNAASSVAQKLASYLHFTQPDVGPMANINTWMPHMGDLLASGLTAQSSKIQMAAMAIAKPIASTVTNVTNTAASNIASGAPTVTGAPNVSSTSNNNNGTTVINLTINSQVKMTKDLIREIDNGLAQLYRSSGLTVNTPSGRRY